MKLFFFISLLFVSSFLLSAQQVRLNELMSSNGGSLHDLDGDTPDWIELYNSGTSAVNLNGFGLSDKKDKPFQWVFPSYTILPGEYLLVFASDKDRREPPLNWNTIISQGDEWRYLVPTSEPATNWRLSAFNDASWTTGKSGFGFADGDDATTVTVTRSVFLRKKFTIANAADVKQVILHMDYDDGFVAYLNGVEIARSYMDAKGDLPRFDATASGDHEALIYRKLAPEKFVVANMSAIKTGENILSVQVHNANTSSSDLSAIPFLSVGTSSKPANQRIVELLQLTKTEFHTNFKLDADGESLYLTQPSGALADSVRFGALQLDYSFGRTMKDPLVWAVFVGSTPAMENVGETLSGESAGKPTFSLPGGIYKSAIKVSLTAPNKGDTIYYTLDGSVPTKASAMAIREIDIPATKVLRARIYKAGMLPGETVTNSYIVYDNKNMPVVSISMNPADLWDHYSGIYVLGPNAEAANPNFGANFWMDWEKACHFELMETSGKKVIDVDAGTKIFGNWSRANAQKSMAFYCRKSYGFDKMEYKIFKDRPFLEYKDLVLRNSGNDWNQTLIRDGVMTGLTMGMNMTQQAHRAATIFLNGEYWGVLNMREKINEHMIAQQHDVKADEISILEGNGWVVTGNNQDYWTMMNFLENNSLSTQANYNKMLDWIDVGSFIDYYSAQIFYRNHDWPGNNIRYWKTNDAKGRYRWIIFDTDFGLGIWGTQPTENTLELATATNGPNWPNPPWSTLLFRRLLENTTFRNQFVNRFADLLNSTFLADNVHRMVDRKRDAIDAEMPSHLKRWNNGSYNDWLNNVNVIKNFAYSRPTNVFSHIQQKFKFQMAQRITVRTDSLAGSIQLNSLKLTKFPWSGSYYAEVPVSLTALPKAGYRFVKWEGVTTNSNMATITVNPKALMDLKAVFEKDGSHYEDIVINEINYNGSATADPGDWIELYNKGLYDVDISGWKITDSDPTHQFVFAAGTILKSKQYLVISNDLVKFKSVFGTVKYLHEPFIFDFGLSNATDAVKLYSKTEQLIDEVNYMNDLPWPVSSLDELWTIELTHPAKDNNRGANWVLSQRTGTPGAHNTSFIPDAVNDLAVGQPVAQLLQNYPNPFSEGTYIEFELEQPGKFSLTILDVNGRLVRTLPNGNQFSAKHTEFWDGKDQVGKSVPSGVYFYRLEADGVQLMKRMVKL